MILLQVFYLLKVNWNFVNSWDTKMCYKIQDIFWIYDLNTLTIAIVMNFNKVKKRCISKWASVTITWSQCQTVSDPQGPQEMSTFTESSTDIPLYDILVENGADELMEDWRHHSRRSMSSRQRISHPTPWSQKESSFTKSMKEIP